MSGTERQAAAPGEPARFPWLRVAAIMTLVAAVGGVAVSVLGPRLSSDSSADWNATVAWAFGLVWVTYMATIVAFTRAAPLGLQAMTWAFFGAMVLRMVACLGIAGVAVRMQGFPGEPMAVSLAAAYLPMLLVEVLGVTRFMRTAGPHLGRGVGQEAISS